MFSFYEAILFIILAGFLATGGLMFFSFCGSLFIDTEKFRLFGAYIVLMIAMMIAGFNIPGLSKISLNLTWITFFTLIIGLFRSLKHREKEMSLKKNVKEDFFTMLLLLILPSLDGNIFFQSVRGLLNIYSNPSYVFTVAFTILSGPGSWSLAAQIGATVGKKKGSIYALLGGGICMLFALGVTILGQVFKGTIPSLFAYMAATAIFISSIIIKYGKEPPGKLLSIPLSIILFALILSLSSLENVNILEIMACFIAFLAIILAYNTRNLKATIGLFTLLIIEFIMAHIIGLDAALKLIIFTYTPYVLLFSVNLLGSKLEKWLK